MYIIENFEAKIHMYLYEHEKDGDMRTRNSITLYRLGPRSLKPKPDQSSLNLSSDSNQYILKRCHCIDILGVNKKSNYGLARSACPNFFTGLSKLASFSMI